MNIVDLNGFKERLIEDNYDRGYFDGKRAILLEIITSDLPMRFKNEAMSYLLHLEQWLEEQKKPSLK